MALVLQLLEGGVQCLNLPPQLLRGTMWAWVLLGVYFFMCAFVCVCICLCVPETICIHSHAITHAACPCTHAHTQHLQ